MFLDFDEVGLYTV